MDPLLGLIIFAALLWLWHNNLRAKELAIASARRMCQNADVQLLDATVVLSWWGIKRRGRRFFLCRLYYFDYTNSGVERRRGVITLIGQQLDTVQQLPDTH